MPGGHPHWREPLWENTQEEPCGMVPVAVVLAVVTEEAAAAAADGRDRGKTETPTL